MVVSDAPTPVLQLLHRMRTTQSTATTTAAEQLAEPTAALASFDKPFAADSWGKHMNTVTEEPVRPQKTHFPPARAQRTKAKLPEVPCSRSPLSPSDRDTLGLEYEPDELFSAFKPTSFSFQSETEITSDDLQFCSNNGDFFSGVPISPVLRSVGSKLWTLSWILHRFFRTSHR